MSSKVLIIFFITLTFIYAQKDSVKNYNLSEITIQSSILVKAKPLSIISSKKIMNLNSFSVDKILSNAPSIKVQNNSRGESLIYFRGSGKRQLTLFFDGVPLNIPWDNRIDLSLLPTDALESIEITKGIPSVVYGANTIAGVVNVFSLKPQNKGNFSVQLGENNYQKYSGFLNNKIGKINYLISLSYFKRDGFYLSTAFESLNKKRNLRLNSFINSVNGLLKFNYNYGTSSNTSVLFTLNSAEKGIPPELNVSKPRYWKYPVWRKLSTIVNGTHKFKSHSNISYSFSATKFDLQINQYKSNKYSELDDIEMGEDISFYGKVLFTKIFAPSTILKFVASGLTSQHIEEIKSDEYENVVYLQNIFSSGIEYEYLKNKFSTIIGISIDGQTTPKTGKQPAKDMLWDVGGNITFSYPIFANIHSQISFGKKSRFPTMREQFSGALGRFILNPKLKPESAYSTEISLSNEIKNFKNELNIFLSYIKDGIVRISLPNKKFMRINKTAIRNYGFELINKINLHHNFNAALGFSYLNSFAKNDKGKFVDTLEYKPNFILNGELNYLIFNNLETHLEANFIGEEFGIKKGEDGFQKLDSYLIMNFKISYLLNFKNIQNLKAYFRVNNIFDKLYYTQWGLPEAGRQFFIGFSLSF